LSSIHQKDEEEGDGDNFTQEKRQAALRRRMLNEKPLHANEILNEYDKIMKTIETVQKKTAQALET